ncbi:predicted protein [Arabidopsis lyrata subsp. lyrata]|uniref:Predicted protein n=1 Tax=Arabidopsis lyrata subsp. lyrata TaxID=81972 RepID=D7LGS4_ARALL|nr:predicted protein [Arabidopsis lyrata subsp. lyrata]
MASNQVSGSVRFERLFEFNRSLSSPTSFSYQISMDFGVFRNEATSKWINRLVK